MLVQPMIKKPPALKANRSATQTNRGSALQTQFAPPGSNSSEGRLVFWRRPIFPGGCPPSIVGADSFHDRVRDGNGWDAVAVATRKRCLLPQQSGEGSKFFMFASLAGEKTRLFINASSPHKSVAL